MVESLSNNADKSDVDAEVENHRTTEVHDQPQPPEAHGDEAHSEDFALASDLRGISAARDLPTVVSEETGKIPGIEGIVELFIDDADPRGEAFADFLFSFPDTANALGENDSAMFVVNNEEEFSSRRTNSTPEDFDQAYLTTERPVRQLVGYIELFLADYTQGQDSLETYMKIPLAAEQIGGSKQAMRVINEGDDDDAPKDYRA